MTSFIAMVEVYNLKSMLYHIFKGNKIKKEGLIMGIKATKEYKEYIEYKNKTKRSNR
jgi:hypothetical protein